MQGGCCMKVVSGIVEGTLLEKIWGGDAVDMEISKNVRLITVWALQ